MANSEPSQRNPDENSSFSIPRGGPIFVPDLVSPLTRVSVFETEVFHLLESLKAELGSEPDEVDEDISVDELKIYSDEELVSEAMRVAFEDDQVAGTSSDHAGNQCSSGEVDSRAFDLGTSASCESPDSYSSDPSYDGEEDGANLKKRKGRAKAKTNLEKKKNKKSVVRSKDKQIDETYLAKVEHLAKLRQKQEEDKASVKLHSFNHRNDDNALISSGNVGTLKCLEFFNCPLKGKCSLTGKYVPIRYPEVILSIEVYHNKQTSKKTQQLLVLGSQVLTELRDKIRCLTDVVMQKAGDHDPSGYFLVEDMFCNDMRDPSAIEYSEPILDWLNNSKEEALAKWSCILSGKNWKLLLDDKSALKLPKFRKAVMEKTRFCDLRFRLGAGYLYCHQGDCKHIIVIRDMRLIHPEDVQNRAVYPLVVYQPKAILKKCSVCHIYKATKVTLDDKVAGENPCYFCDNCYYLLHYSADGTLLYNKFQVYDYLQDYY